MSFRPRFTGRLLRPAVNLLGTVSRAGAPYSNQSMIKYLPGHRSQDPIILDFCSDKGQTNVENWYRKQGTNTRFTSLEYRKDKHGTFKHEFIVVHLQTGDICRFDRRAREDSRGHALKDEGTLAEDTAHVLSPPQPEYQETTGGSEVLLTIELPKGEDLRLILAICCGIQTHPQAISYSLLRYNCYFFSWTIVTAVARHASQWEQATTPELWDYVVKQSVRFISPFSKQGEPPKEQTLPWHLGKAARPPVPGIHRDEASTELFRDELQLQLKRLRPIVAETLRELLLRSQLAHRLRLQLREHSLEALTTARVTAAAGSAAAAAMRHVSGARTKPTEPRKYGELSWKMHCDIAWEVASEAAYSAAVVCVAGATANNKRTGGERKMGYDSEELKPSEQEWDRIWETNWRARTPRSSFTSHNKELGITASREGKAAWGAAWRNATELSHKHLSDIADNVAKILLERLGELDSAQHIHVTGDQNRTNNAHLQSYIRKRMQDHFELVDKFGFGRFQDLLNHAEESMCDIWMTAIGELKKDRFKNTIRWSV